MEWIKTEEKLPDVGQEIEMTCKHWQCNWVGNFENPYIDKGNYDEFGNFWNSEGPRIDIPTYWRPYQPERSKREDFKIVAEMETTEELLNQGPQPPKLPNFKDAVL